MDRRRIRRSATFAHVVTAFGIGTATSLLVATLNRFSPSIFGIFTVPSSVLLPLYPPIAALVSPRTTLILLERFQLAGGCVSYSVIAFLALYRFVWRNPS